MCYESCFDLCPYGTGYSCSLPAEDLPAACEREKAKRMPPPGPAGEGKSN